MKTLLVIAVCLCVGGYADSASETKRTLEIRSAHLALVHDVAAGDFSNAFALTTPDFRQSHSVEAFAQSITNGWMFLGVPSFEYPTSTTVSNATRFWPTTFGLLRRTGGFFYDYQQVDGKWLFTGTSIALP